MTRAITEEEFLASASETLASLGDDAVVIERNGTFVAALVSEKEFEEIGRARGRRASAVLDRFNDAMLATGATEEELKELERA